MEVADFTDAGDILDSSAEAVKYPLRYGGQTLQYLQCLIKSIAAMDYYRQVVAQCYAALPVEGLHLAFAVFRLPVEIYADFSDRVVKSRVLIYLPLDDVDGRIGIVGEFGWMQPHRHRDFSGESGSETFHRLDFIESIGGKHHMADPGMQGSLHRLFPSLRSWSRRGKDYPLFGVAGLFLGQKDVAIEMGVAVDQFHKKTP